MNKIINFIVKLIATGLGTGYSPIIPGTIGSLAGVIIFFLLFKLKLSILQYIVFCISLFLIGVYTSQKAEILFAKKDSRQIVIDEIVACGVFLALVPHTKWCIICAFILFRILDVLKPFPANKSQNLPGGWGIMMDDLIVSIYTVIVINLILLAGKII